MVQQFKLSKSVVHGLVGPMCSKMFSLRKFLTCSEELSRGNRLVQIMGSSRWIKADSALREAVDEACNFLAVYRDNGQYRISATEYRLITFYTNKLGNRVDKQRRTAQGRAETAEGFQRRQYPVNFVVIDTLAGVRKRSENSAGESSDECENSDTDTESDSDYSTENSENSAESTVSF
uniref:Chromatin modification-related protein eaf7 n=1 Tax=Steinernema glaseri TaxID=37863 RepID=A0A1I7YP32_9BILA